MIDETLPAHPESSAENVLDLVLFNTSTIATQQLKEAKDTHLANINYLNTESKNLKTNTSTSSTRHTWLNSSVIYSTHTNPQRISKNHKLNITSPSLKCTPIITTPQP